MNVLQELESFINEFNQKNDEDFQIDTIRIDFDKQYKKEKLEQLGKWKKINKNNQTIMSKLKKRLTYEEITTALQFEEHNIYYFNKKDDSKKYRKATMIIFGLKQYHNQQPNFILINKIVSILKNINSIDLCLDMEKIPNLVALTKVFDMKQYFNKSSKFYGDTYYINDTGVLMLDKVTIYNKALKNALEGVLWRIEATISIPNIKYLALPLYEFKTITDLAKGN